jgi:hypothetical protein
MKVSGERTLRSEKAEVFRSGKMGQYMKAGGTIIKLTEEVDLFMLNVISTRESGWMTRLMVTESTFIWMGQHIRDTGVRTSNMAKE